MRSPWGADTITFPSHGLVDSDLVTLAPDPLPTPIDTPTGSLSSTRTYRVVVVDPNTLKLGASFNSAQLVISSPVNQVPTVDLSDPLNIASGVDAARNIIKFTGPHQFQTGDAIRYDTNGNPSI